MMLSNKPLYKQNIQCLYKYTYYNLEKKLFLEILLLDLRLAREHFFMISYGFRSKLFIIKKIPLSLAVTYLTEVTCVTAMERVEI